MTQPIQSVLVVGAGSAGLMAAMALKRSFPSYKITILHSLANPVIGVGESTTVVFPPFLHRSLGLDVQEFFREVRPSWKLGVRFIWGDPSDDFFNYPFDSCMATRRPALRKLPPYYCQRDWSDASRCWALMDRGLSPCIPANDGSISLQDAFGYHLDNARLIHYLTTKAASLGIELVEGELQTVQRTDAGHVQSVSIGEDRSISADLFLDCSGFQSLLLGRELGESFVSYSDSLFCDRAVVARWNHSGPVNPYTIAETMDSGWCWQIDFAEEISRGYVYSSDFCSDEAALDEFTRKNPSVDETRVVKFRSGRYANFGLGNVFAIGNSCGFVEPLEATALHLAIEQIRLLCRLLAENDGRIIPELLSVANTRYRLLWDEVRDFLAVHYRFNRRSDSAFWQHCRNHTDLAGAADLVELYQHAGPSLLCEAVLPGAFLFGYDGFMALLVGQRVATQFKPELTDDDLRRWDAYRDDVRQAIAHALPMREALQQLCWS